MARVTMDVLRAHPIPSRPSRFRAPLVTVAGAATALTLIGTSLTGFDHHVFGWDSWPGARPRRHRQPGPPRRALGAEGQGPQGPPVRARADRRPRLDPRLALWSPIAAAAQPRAPVPSPRPSRCATAPTAAPRTPAPRRAARVTAAPAPWPASATTSPPARPATPRPRTRTATVCPTPWSGRSGRNPNAKDTDGDGLPDGWEEAHGLDPLSASRRRPRTPTTTA